MSITTEFVKSCKKNGRCISPRGEAFVALWLENKISPIGSYLKTSFCLGSELKSLKPLLNEFGDKIFLKKYAGQTSNFWLMLEELHHKGQYWTQNQGSLDLSDTGEAFVKEIKKYEKTKESNPKESGRGNKRAAKANAATNEGSVISVKMDSNTE